MTTEQQTTAQGAQIRAAVSLLSDSDPRIVAACREKILSCGESSRVILEELSRCEDAGARLRARDLLRSLGLRDWLQRVGRFSSRVARGAEPDVSVLEEGAVLLSDVGRFRPGDADGLQAKIASLSFGLRALVAGRSSQTAARNLGAYIAGEQGLEGSGERPVPLYSLYLDEVLRRNAGHPIALVILYLIIGRRAGLELTAVRMPDGFLVRVHGRRRVLVDPFHDGRTVTRQDCLRYLRSTGQSSSLYLGDLDDVDVLREFLEALRRSAGRSGDPELRSALSQAAMHLVTI